MASRNGRQPVAQGASGLARWQIARYGILDQRGPKESIPDLRALIGERSTLTPEAARAATDPFEPRSSHRALESLNAFALGVSLMLFFYAGGGGVPGHDSFYHIKMAELLPQHGIFHEFPWLRFVYFTDDGSDFVEHHYGFHVLLAPFVGAAVRLTGDALAGGRWAMAVCLGINLVLLLALLRTANLRWRWLWMLLFLLLPMQFFTRHAFIRAIGPSLAFMLLIVLTLFRRRYLLTALAIAGYIHLYLGGLIYAPLIVGLYVLATLLARPAPLGRELSRLLGWSIAGWAAGWVSHPYAQHALAFLKLQVFGSGLAPDIAVGREWKPYSDLWWFAMMCGPVMITWAVAVCLRLRSGGRADAPELFLLLSNFAFLTLTFKARRFIEYWPIFCLLSAAWLAAPWLRRVAAWFDGAIVDGGGQAASARLPRRLALSASMLLVGAGTLVGAIPHFRGIRQSVRCGYDLPAIRAAMEFLRNNSQPGDVVFTDDWDVFPVFFYFNSHNHYIVGLDPKFTHAREPELWERYVKISRGQVPATISVANAGESDSTRSLPVVLEDIRDHFGARFVVTDADHRALAAKLSRVATFAELLYPCTSYADCADAPYLVFRVAGPANEAPDDVGPPAAGSPMERDNVEMEPDTSGRK